MSAATLMKFACSHACGAASGSVDRSPFRNEFDVRNRSHDVVNRGERRNGGGEREGNKDEHQVDTTACVVQ